MSGSDDLGGISEKEFLQRHSDEVQHLQNKYDELARRFKNYKQEHGGLQNLFRQLHAAVDPIEPLPMEYRREAGKAEVTHPCAAVMRVSDGHHGMVQDPDEIEGFGVFSPAHSKARQLGYARDFVGWVELHRHSYVIDELHIIVTGDLISGDIHAELTTTNAWPVPVQAIKAGDLLAMQVGIVAPHFKRVVVHFISADNHSRLTKKPQSKEEGLNSMNYVVGSHAAVRLREHGNVEFNLYPMFEKVIHVLNRQYLISHGHAVTGWMGIPWYGIERKMGRESVARLQIIMEDLSRAYEVGFHKYVFGHWHVPVNMPLYMCCGSVSGTDAYDHKNGRHAKPSQSAWLVHPTQAEIDVNDFGLMKHDDVAVSDTTVYD